MMQSVLGNSVIARVPRRIVWLRSAVEAACQNGPLPHRSSTQMSAAAAATRAPSDLRRPAACNGRMQQQQYQQHRARLFSTNSLSSASPSSEEEPSSNSDSSSQPVPLPSSSSTSRHTVVKHPPAPGWEFPPVPDGCEPTFAVIRLGNTQHKVTKDDVIVAEKVAGDIGTTLDISDVLLVGTRDSTIVGRPTVPGAMVKLFVEEQTRDQKVLVFKKRRRKSSKTTKGHRREVTLLRVTEIAT